MTDGQSDFISRSSALLTIVRNEGRLALNLSVEVAFGGSVVSLTRKSDLPRICQSATSLPKCPFDDVSIRHFVRVRVEFFKK
jgi:hypothetical protein